MAATRRFDQSSAFVAANTHPGPAADQTYGQVLWSERRLFDHADAALRRVALFDFDFLWIIKSGDTLAVVTGPGPVSFRSVARVKGGFYSEATGDLQPVAECLRLGL